MILYDRIFQPLGLGYPMTWLKKTHKTAPYFDRP